MKDASEPELILMMVTHAGLKLRHLLSQSFLQSAAHARNNKAVRMLSRLGFGLALRGCGGSPEQR